MALVGELELPSFDYTDPQLRGERFHTAMRELAAQGWLAAGPYGYIVLDREAGEHFLRTRSAIFPGMKIAELFDVKEGPLYEEMRRNILHVNGPLHTRLRSLVNPALSPRAVERYRPLMRELLEELYEGVMGASGASRGAGADSSPGGEAGSAPGGVGGGANGAEFDFVEAFSKPYPSQVIASVMGAPLSDAPRLHHWSNWIQRQFDAHSMMNEREGIEAAVEEFYEYAHALLDARREDRRDDLISALLSAEQEGDRLSEVECVNLVLNVLIGGVDTTQSQLSHTIRLLAEHPEQWEALVANPSLAERAVEEGLRYEPITPFTARITVEEVTFRDVTFPPDTVVMVCAFTANRDLPGGEATPSRGTAAERPAEERPAESGPERFDITVERPRARPLTFGAGVHYCLGANLARLELQEGLAFLAERVPRLELAGDPEFESITGIYGLSRLPVRFGG